MRRLHVLAHLGLLLLLAVPALAAPASPAQRCRALKLVAAGAETRALLVCEQHGFPTPRPASCAAVATGRRTAAFARLDASGACAVTGDSPVVGDAVEELVVATLDATTPGGPSGSRCGFAELGAAVRALGELVRAHARDVRSPDAARLASDLAAAEARFARAFGRAQQHGDCVSSLDAATAFAVLDAGVARLRALLSERCGNGVTDGAEECDGSTCEASGSSAPDGCFPPGTGDECRCCAGATPCYVRTLASEPIEIPCCTGVCDIPGPEAGPNVTVFCRQSSCPCWSSPSLDAAFPPGFFDAEGRGGALCDPPDPLVGYAAADSCTLFGPVGMTFVFPRGGAVVFQSNTCLLFPDLDADDDGVCSGPPEVQAISAEEAAACLAEMQASQSFRAACLGGQE